MYISLWIVCAQEFKARILQSAVVLAFAGEAPGVCLWISCDRRVLHPWLVIGCHAEVWHEPFWSRGVALVSTKVHCGSYEADEMLMKKRHYRHLKG
jgi:hypothetical protein